MPSNVFEIHVFKIDGNSKFLLLSVEKSKRELIYLKNLLFTVEELFNVVELISVVDTPFARFARYGMKISILKRSRF